MSASHRDCDHANGYCPIAAYATLTADEYAAMRQFAAERRAALAAFDADWR